MSTKNDAIFRAQSAQLEAKGYFHGASGYNNCAECGSSLGADDSAHTLCGFCEDRERGAWHDRFHGYDRDHDCRVFWGSHGCRFARGHDGAHECDCCECPDHALDHETEGYEGCVGKPPYYGPETKFYGEDVDA